VSNESKSETINWTWLITCCAGGAALIGIALFLQTGWGWSGVVTETLVEAGVAGVFVGLAFLFERAFVRKVGKVAASAAEATFAQRTEGLEARIEDLTKAVRERERADVQAQTELVSALENPTLTNIDAAMQEATRVSGLAENAENRIKVTASPDPDTLSLSFSRFTSDGKPAFEISLIPEIKAKAHPTDLVPVIWVEGEDAVDVGHSISNVIQHRRLLGGLDDFDWSIAMANLKHSIDTAIRSRGMDSGDWHLKGGLYELLGNDWAVSSAGLEHRDPDCFVSRRDMILIHPLKPDDKRPDWCDESDWRWLVRRAREVISNSIPVPANSKGY
jgi:hypothetical protein